MIPLVWLENGGDQSTVTSVESTRFTSTFLGGPLGANIGRELGRKNVSGRADLTQHQWQ